MGHGWHGKIPSHDTFILQVTQTTLNDGYMHDLTPPELLQMIQWFDFRGVQGVILVYDVTDQGSLNDLNSWISELQTYADKSNIVGLVLGNKIDKVKK